MKVPRQVQSVYSCLRSASSCKTYIAPVDNHVITGRVSGQVAEHASGSVNCLILQDGRLRCVLQRRGRTILRGTDFFRQAGWRSERRQEAGVSDRREDEVDGRADGRASRRRRRCEARQQDGDIPGGNGRTSDSPEGRASRSHKHDGGIYGGSPYFQRQNRLTATQRCTQPIGRMTRVCGGDGVAGVETERLCQIVSG